MKRQHVAVALWLSTYALSCQALSPAQIDSARFAGTLKEVVIFGSSSFGTVMKAYMQNVVCNNSGDYDEFWNDENGATFRAYSCTMPVANGYPVGTKLLVIKRDMGDSIYGVHQVALNTPGMTMVVNSTACPEYNHEATPAAICLSREARIPTAGISDVDPYMFPRTYTVAGVAQQRVNYPDPATNDDVGNAWNPLTMQQLNELDVASVGQTIFGVVVTKPLRDALQLAQGLPAGSEAEGDTPSLSSAFVTGVLSGFVRGGPQANYASWKSVTGASGDDAKKVVICRGTRGSGIQAVANAHFLKAAAASAHVPNDPVDSALHDTAQGMLTPLASGQPAGVDGSPVPGVTVNEGSAATSIEYCLRTHTYDYAIAVLPRTRVALLHGDYRFVRLDGALPRRSAARVGAYPMVYTSTMQWRKILNAPDAQTKSFLIGIRVNAVTSNKLALYGNTEAKDGLLASPHKWQVQTDTCGATTDLEDALYGSCVERVDLGDTIYNPGVHIDNVHSAYWTSNAAPLHLVK